MDDVDVADFAGVDAHARDNSADDADDTDTGNTGDDTDAGDSTDMVCSGDVDDGSKANKGNRVEKDAGDVDSGGTDFVGKGVVGKDVADCIDENPSFFLALR